MATPIGTLGSIPSITVAGRTYTDLANLIVCYAYANTGNYGTFRKTNASSGYAVTALKTFTFGSVIGMPSSGGGNSVYGSILYGDTDVGMSGGSPPTNAVHAFGGTSGYINAAFGTGGAFSQTVNAGLPINFTVPAGKYPAMYAAGGQLGMMMYGYEA